MQGNRFDAVDRRFDMADKAPSAERFDAEKLNASASTWPIELNRDRFEAVGRFDRPG